MIIAGIDEAGYGPLLGPLTVGCCAFEIEMDPAAASLPCLWKALRKFVGKSRSKSGRKIHVNDSKLVYSPSIGVKELERAVLVLAGCAWRDWDGSCDALLERLSAGLSNRASEYPWYEINNEAIFPMQADGLSVRLLTNAARQQMSSVNVGCVHLRVEAVLERDFNDSVRQTRNKGSVLFSVAARHIDFLLRTYSAASGGLVLFCDRHGGREHYGRLLMQMFEEWSLEIVDEQPARSEYLLSRNHSTARIIFCEKAEQSCMSVAVASMLSKYIRELLMHRFNAFWSRYVPGLQPTAGYYNDGLRFLRDIEARRMELNIDDHQLVRCR